MQHYTHNLLAYSRYSILIFTKTNHISCAYNVFLHYSVDAYLYKLSNFYTVVLIYISINYLISTL